ncbi:MAG: MBL fold metallo-hydrolase [Chloroflexota bacterium]|nr:MBL fold metallo-hydrolase [Chloroflexota bacterium]
MRLWGTRGSLAAPGPDTARYGGNTSCVQVTGSDGTELVLDAGTGVRLLGAALPRSLRRLDVLITHLHMDHILGLGFFAPLRVPGLKVHIWGPASATQSLAARLTRYLSPPLFPVRLRDLDAEIDLHEVPCGDFSIGEFRVSAALVCHPDPTVGYRITSPAGTVAYLPDHEPALGARPFPIAREWTSGHDLARGVDILIHDTQYTGDEYAERVGWGHSSVPHSFAFAQLAGVRTLVPFHHDPSHNDDDLDDIFGEAVTTLRPPFDVTPATEGASFDLA